MLEIIKKIHTQPFWCETRSISKITLYRVFSALSWLFYRVKYRKTLKETRAFIALASKEVAKKNKSAFVFANGTSMKDIDLHKIKQLCEADTYDLIAINSYLSNSAEIAPPRFAVFADKLHFAEGETQYKRDINVCEELGIPYFSPARYVNKAHPLRRGFCSLTNIDSVNCSDITKPLGYYGLTALFALSLAKMIGYEKIYICGFDNDYFKDFGVGPQGDMYISHRHYYDEESKDTRVPCIYASGTEFFFDTYRYFQFVNKVNMIKNQIHNVAKVTYISEIPRDFSLNIYK